MLLTVGTDSTWSLRAWICSQIADIQVELYVIDLSATDYKPEILKHSVTGLVPSLKDNNCIIHDSLAITEHFNECSDGALYPDTLQQRSLARSLCAELHSGFTNLRTQCPFSLQPVQPLKVVDQSIKDELLRIEKIFQSAEIPFMFEKAGAIDAFYSILAYRLNSYGINFDGKAGHYQQSLLNWSVLNQAISEAKSWKNI